jgi:DNA-binding LacI/PurR family transcriptional regulator
MAVTMLDIARGLNVSAVTIPDGIFCYNDPVAIGAMKAIFDAGLNVPRDIAVVGAGNLHYSDVLAVPLTTVDQGTRQMGKQAAELLMEQIGIEEDAAATAGLDSSKIRGSRINAAHGSSKTPGPFSSRM